MSMRTLDFAHDSPTSPHSRPCLHCRRRKVKCDKTRPTCSNCTRSKQLCSYERVEMKDGASNDMASDLDLRERLARLESMMAKMMVGDATKKNIGTSDIGNEYLNDRRHGTSMSPSNTTQTKFRSQSEISLRLSRKECNPIGQILFQDGYSAYFDAEFWPGLISEIEDLRNLFELPREEVAQEQWISMCGLGIQSPLSTTGFSLAHPTLEESNILCKLFFDNVNPFIRALHQSLIARELGQYRRGTFHLPREFEALLFSIYLLAVNSTPPDKLERLFSTSKEILLARYQHSAQVALINIDFFKTEKIHGFGAILHYLTFLFQQNLYKDAISLLGVASRLAQTMGVHRDPSHFPFSPWVCEIRRRLWNHLCVLDGLAISSYGAETCLPSSSDALPPCNADDLEWNASRFANPSSVPSSNTGLRGTTFALVHRDISDLTRDLAGTETGDFEKKERLIENVEQSLREKHLDYVDPNIASETIVTAFVEIKLSSLRLSLRHQQTRKLKSVSFDPERYEVFAHALTHLELLNYHIALCSPSHSWIFSTHIPFLALAILLTDLPSISASADKERAKLQIETMFQRFEEPGSVVRESRMWKVLRGLKEQMEGGGMALGSFESGRASDDFMGGLVERTGFSGEEGNESFMGLEMQDLPWMSGQMPF